MKVNGGFPGWPGAQEAMVADATAAAVGVSAYWSVTVGSMLAFLPGVSGYSLVPGPGYWLFVGAYMIFGALGLLYLMFRGDTLLR